MPFSAETVDYFDNNRPSSIKVIETNSFLNNVSPDDFIIDGKQSPFALAFLSPHVNFHETVHMMRKAAGGTIIMAVTTAGEIASCDGRGSVYKNTGQAWDTIILQVFPADLFDTVCIRSVPLHNKDVRAGFPSIDRNVRIGQIAQSLNDIKLPFLIDVHDTIALTYIDGLSYCENYFMEAVYQTGRFPCLFVGGSAAGKYDYKNTYIFDGEKTLENHAVIAFLKLAENRSYGVFKSQNFKKTGKSFLVVDANTDRRSTYSVVDPKTNEVRPFLDVLAQTFNVDRENVGDSLKGYTFGIEIENELFVRSVSRIHKKSGNISFYCDINPGDRLELLQATSFIEQTKKDLQDFLEHKPKPIGAILNDCILRRLNNEPHLDEMSEIWPMPVAGFSTFGELFGINLNQTLAAVVFFGVSEHEIRDKFISNFPIHYAQFVKYFQSRYDLSRENLLAMQRTLREEAEKSNAIMENLLEGVIAFDNNGTIQTFNKGAEQAFGTLSSAMLGTNIKTLMPDLCPESRPDSLMACFNEKANGTTDVECEIQGVRNNGDTFPISLKISKVLFGERELFVAVIRDLTLQKKREEAFLQAKETADMANRAKSEFLANMSHELRTPLNSILGMNRLLKETHLNEEQNELADAMFRSSVNLLEIVNDILDLSKIEAGEMRLERIGFDPTSVLDTVIASLEPLATEKMISLIKSYDIDFPYVIGDPTRISSVLNNLIGNAIKYTDKGHVEVKSSFRRIDTSHVELFCEIIDTGIGISQEKQNKIFEKFVQGDSTMTRKYGGTGLGLAITRQLIDIMSGSIGVRSEEGVGSTFWFTIPFDITDRLHEEKYVQQQKALLGMLPPENARILIAEDHPTNQLLIKKLMQKFNIGSVEIVENGLEVLKHYKEKEWDVILMDCHMPQKSGYDATEDIRSLERATRVHVPIVAMTANAMVGDREKCLLCGMDDYISKPIDVDRLKEVLGQWIRFSN